MSVGETMTALGWRHDPDNAKSHVDVARSARDTAESIVTIVEAIFASLDELGGAFAEGRRCARREGIAFSKESMCALQPSIFHVLDTVDTTHSAGLFVAEDILDDVSRSFEWWHRGEGAQGYEPLLLELNLESPDCYDYYEMEWFRAARTFGARHVTGPLIDLPCASVLVMTFATPVMDGSDFLGIAGADVKVSRLESHLIRAMTATGAPCVLVNSQRRVIASSSPRWRAADRLPATPRAGSQDWSVVLDVTGDLGWRLAVERPAPLRR